MARASNREKLLEHGLTLVHERGFGSSSVRDIVQAAEVPQGSFTNHFASKEAFGLEILERYGERTRARTARTLRNDDLAPLARLRLWLEEHLAAFEAGECKRGCLYGNLSAEAAAHSEPLRERVAEVFAQSQESVAYCLGAAMRAGELPPNTDAMELAGFIVSSLQGAQLVAKTQRSPAAIQRLIRVIFASVLAR